MSHVSKRVGNASAYIHHHTALFVSRMTNTATNFSVSQTMHSLAFMFFFVLDIKNTRRLRCLDERDNNGVCMAYIPLVTMKSLIAYVIIRIAHDALSTIDHVVVIMSPSMNDLLKIETDKRMSSPVKRRHG